MLLLLGHFYFSFFADALWMRNINPADEIPLKVILENRLDRKVVLWFYLGVLFPFRKGVADGLRLGWKAHTSAPNAQVHGSSGYTCSAVRLRHCDTALDQYRWSGRKDGSPSIDLQRSCTLSNQTETQGHKGSSVASGGGGRGNDEFSSNLEFRSNWA